MYENPREDISRKLNYTSLTLFGEKLNIGIIGAGRGALIKAKNFYNKGSKIEVLALDFLEEFNEFDKSQVKLIRCAYNENFIKDKHLIIIAIDDYDVIKKIKEDCEKLFKIYINSSDFKDGMGAVPVSRESEKITISINTKVGNPRGAVMVANKLLSALEELDDYIDFTGKIRNKLKVDKETKNTLLKFINSEDCNYFYDKGKFIEVLRLFYSEEIVEKISLLRKEV